MQAKLSLLSIFSTAADGSGDLGKVQTPGTTGEVTVVMNEGNTRTYRVSGAVANQTVDLAGLATVEYVVIKTDKRIILRINGAHNVTIKPPTGFGFGYFVLCADGITALDVSNPGSDTAAVVVQLGGDL